MMVPKAFVFISAESSPTGKGGQDRQDSRPPLQRNVACSPDAWHLRIGTAATASPPSVTHASPVVIPPKRASRRTSIKMEMRNNGGRNVRRGSGSVRRSSSVNSLNRDLPTAVATLLDATAIPVPRSWTRRNPRRLPPGNHVEDFSRLLREGIKRKEEGGSFLEGSGNSTLDVLLTPPDFDNEKLMLASELEAETPFSIRSLSVDSVPSLDHELGSYLPSDPATPIPSGQRSIAERRPKQLSLSEDCASDHPLIETETTDFTTTPPTLLERATSRSTGLPRTLPRLRSTFKSNLTASLRAIKSAAQTVSTFATPSIHPEDFLTRSVFAIAPELTDDRRPQPMNQPPSPALRRYLNPTTLSPVEMHIHYDCPPGSRHPSHYCSASIQMQTYRRSGCNGDKGPQFSSRGGGDHNQQFYPIDSEVPPITRQREPRENSDFLRMVVLEMNMRRSGKLRDDIPIRAKIWLPPRKMSATRSSNLGPYGYTEDSAVPERWAGVSIGGL